MMVKFYEGTLDNIAKEMTTELMQKFYIIDKLFVVGFPSKHDFALICVVYERRNEDAG